MQARTLCKKNKCIYPGLACFGCGREGDGVRPSHDTFSRGGVVPQSGLQRQKQRASRDDNREAKKGHPAPARSNRTQELGPCRDCGSVSGQL